MPILPSSTYRRSRLLVNGHLETIYPGVFRKVKNVDYERERLTLSDGDFVDLDWLENGSRNLLLLSHGLEGDSSRQYVAGMASYFYKKKWDVLAWNCRSCSGEMNRKLRMYHHGEIGDIGEVIAHALKAKDYERIVLIGFSMGGNISMKYLGVNGKEIPDPVSACVAFSSPTDLKAGAEILDKPSNRLYFQRFLHYLKIKIEKKNEMFPGVVDLENFKKIKVWRDFDEYFTAPLIGLKNAAEFYQIGSAKNFMAGITIPTLLVNAVNDPILPPACFPTDICQAHEKIYLEMPEHGGHCGFWRPGQEHAWSERRAWGFVKEYLNV